MRDFKSVNIKKDFTIHLIGYTIDIYVIFTKPIIPSPCVEICFLYVISTSLD